MIIAIVGPTGVGKTLLSLKLAKDYNAIIVNFDAVQIYKELNIGSAKITPEEMQSIKHYLFDIKTPNEDYNVKEYQQDLRKVLSEHKDENIILVGGTGLYLCAGLMDYNFEDEELNETFDDLTNEELYKLALKKNPRMNIHQNNRVRLIRFLNRGSEPNAAIKFLYDNVHIIGLTTSRDRLYHNLNNRVDKMLDKGLLEEVKELYTKYPDSRVLKTAIGYKELIAFFNKEITLEEAISKIKQNTRHYAKRQYTWFNNKMDVTWFEVNFENFDATVKEIKDYLAKQKPV